MYTKAFILNPFFKKSMNENCTVYKTVDYLAKKWSLLILLELYKGESDWKRYSEIKKKIPDISPKILSARLKELEGHGIISKKIYTTYFPVKSEYSLTKSGKDLINIIKNIAANRFMFYINYAYL